jgi:hypothetical protein
MNRPILACALVTFASAALCAQQTSTTPYSGTSAPPPDDTIETSAPAQSDPLPKPNPGQPADAQPNPATPSVSAPLPNAGPDVSVFQSAPPQTRTTLKVVSSDPDSDIVQAAPLPPGVLGEGTTIRVHLLDRLSTLDSVKGDAFRSSVATDVLEGGQILIPAGAQIEGHVVDVSSGHFGGRGSLRLRPETVTLANGSSYRLVAYVAGAPGAKANVDREGTIGAEARIKRGAIEYGAAVGIGTAAGAIMGGPAGALAGGLIGAGAVTVHLLVSHPQAKLEPGTVLLFTLTQPLNLVATTTTASNQQAPASH